MFRSTLADGITGVSDTGKTFWGFSEFIEYSGPVVWLLNIQSNILKGVIGTF